jgi:dynein heavy chain
LHECLNEYNSLFAAMDLVLFEDAMKHIAKITRIISNPSGHGLLVGVGGIKHKLIIHVQMDLR